MSEWWVAKVIQTTVSDGVFKTCVPSHIFDKALNACKSNKQLVLKRHSYSRCTQSSKEELIGDVEGNDERPRCITRTCDSFEVDSENDLLLFFEREKRLHNSALGCEARFQQCYVVERLELLDKVTNILWVFDIKKHTDELIFYHVYIKSKTKDAFNESVIKKMMTLLKEWER